MILLLNMMFLSRIVGLFVPLILKNPKSKTFVMYTYVLGNVFECYATQCSLNKHKPESVK